MIENPYWDECARYFQLLFEMPVEDWTKADHARQDAVHKYAWTCPSTEIGPELVQRGITHLVEIGAGRGYWAWLLNQYGVKTLAYDQHPGHSGEDFWYTVREGGPETVIGLKHQALMLCWPPYNDPMAHEALKNFEGEFVVYVGEGHGGCTGDDAFHDLLDEDFLCVWENYGPNWPGIHSYEMIWQHQLKSEDGDG